MYMFHFLPHKLYVQREGVQCREARVLVAVYEVLEYVRVVVLQYNANLKIFCNKLSSSRSRSSFKPGHA